MGDLNPILFAVRAQAIKYLTKLSPGCKSGKELNFLKRKLFLLPYSLLLMKTNTFLVGLYIFSGIDQGRGSQYLPDSLVQEWKHSCSGKGMLNGNVGSHDKYLEVTKSALCFHMKIDGGGFWNALWSDASFLKGFLMLSVEAFIRWCCDTMSECGVCAWVCVHVCIFLSFTKCLEYSTDRHVFLPVLFQSRFSSHTSHPSYSLPIRVGEPNLQVSPSHCCHDSLCGILMSLLLVSSPDNWLIKGVK